MSICYASPIQSGSPVQPVPPIQFAGGPLALHITHKLDAGFPSPAGDYTADPLDLNQYLLDRVAYTFLFDVAGWSMSGAHIVEGNKVVVDHSISPQPGHIVVAIVNGEFTIKRLQLVNGAYELPPPREPGFPPNPLPRRREAVSLRYGGGRGQEDAVRTQPPGTAGFALLDVSNFYASCERVINPKLGTRPVMVLSDNDACAVARSNEAKALGIKMTAPWFMMQDLARKHGIVALSSNYTLCADMSNRVTDVLRQYSPRLEVCSIDESFFALDSVTGL